MDQIFFVNSASLFDVSISGSLYMDSGSNVDFSKAIQVSGSFVGNLLGTSSVANTASFVVSASHANFSDVSITSNFASTASFVVSASHANNADISISSSFATNALTASRAATASYVNSGQRIKSGIVSGSAFSGNPQIYNVVFAAPLPTLYSVTIGSDLSARSWLSQNLTSTGFTINSNTKTGVSGMVYWQAIAFGEFNS